MKYKNVKKNVKSCKKNLPPHLEAENPFGLVFFGFKF